MRRNVAYLAVLLLFSGLVACSVFRPRTSYLAKVNQDAIYMEDLKDEFQYRHGGHMKFLEGEAEVKRFLTSMIDQRLLLQEAYRIGLQDDPAIKEENGRFESQKAKEFLLKMEVEEKAKSTDNEIRAVYDQKVGIMLQVLQVVVKTKEEAEEIHKKILAGEDFEAIAREKSIAPSKKFGGRIVPVVWGSMDPDWERIVFALEPEETTPVFQSGMGYEIVRLEERKIAEAADNTARTDNTTKTDKIIKPEFSRVEKRIRAILERRKTTELKEELVRSLRIKYAVMFPPVNLGIEELKKAEKDKNDEPVASWNGGSLSLASFAALLDFDRLSGVEKGDVRGTLRNLLDEVVNDRLFQAEARARGYDNVAEVARKVRQHRERLMLRKLHEDYILAGVYATEEDFKEYFDKHRKEFIHPEKRKIAHILLDSEETAKEVLKRARQGEAFDTLARAYSKDKMTSERGGEVGWIDRDKVSQIFQGVFSTLHSGEIGEPVKSEQGYHIVKLVEIQPEKLKEFPEVREDVEKKVIKQKRDEKVRFWVDKLKTASHIEVREKP